MGLYSFCSFVKSLPHTPQAAVAFALHKLKVPEDMWESFLLCQAHSVPGWSAWTKYKTDQATDRDADDFVGLLAIRLVHDVAIAEQTGIRFGWQSMMQSWKNQKSKRVMTRVARTRFAHLCGPLTLRPMMSFSLCARLLSLPCFSLFCMLHSVSLVLCVIRPSPAVLMTTCLTTIEREMIALWTRYVAMSLWGLQSFPSILQRSFFRNTRAYEHASYTHTHVCSNYSRTSVPFPMRP